MGGQVAGLSGHVGGGEEVSDLDEEALSLGRAAGVGEELRGKLELAPPTEDLDRALHLARVGVQLPGLATGAGGRAGRETATGAADEGIDQQVGRSRGVPELGVQLRSADRIAVAFEQRRRRLPISGSFEELGREQGRTFLQASLGLGAERVDPLAVGLRLIHGGELDHRRGRNEIQ